MSDSGHLSAPVRLLLRFFLTIALVYVLSTFLDRTFVLTPGLIPIIIVAALITLMNVIVRPLLNIILLPFKLFMGLVVLIGANALILWFTQVIVAKMDPSVIVLEIEQGLGGWLLIALILGFSNWVMKEVLR